MKKQITHICVHTSSRFLGLLNFLIAAMICTPTAILAFLLTRNVEFLAILLIPFVVWLAGYLCSALFAWIYNFAAKQCGGLEYYTQEVEAD